MKGRIIAMAMAAGAFLAPLAASPEGPVSRDSGAGRFVDARAAARAMDDGDPAAVVEELRTRVARQFVTYSALTPWRTPARAFDARAGYSAQYNLALLELLHAAGIKAKPVFAARVSDGSDRPWWRTAHVWVQVDLDGRTRDVCAGLSDAGGTIAFTPMTDVLDFGPRTRTNTAVVLTLVAAWYRWRKIVGRDYPRFLLRPFRERACGAPRTL